MWVAEAKAPGSQASGFLAKRATVYTMDSAKQVSTGDATRSLDRGLDRGVDRAAGRGVRPGELGQPASLTFRADAPRPGLSILIPVYNERATVRGVLDKVRAVKFPVEREIIMVDDGSTDGSRDVLSDLPDWPDVRVVMHEKNAGKGAAIQTALKHARGEIVVIQDADLELEPTDLIPLFDVVHRGESDVCYGSRFMGDNKAYRGMPTYWANRSLNFVCNVLNGIRITDMNTCYKMMRAEVAKKINLTSRGFAMEPEITTKLARLGVRIVERPITYRPRGRDEGKKIRKSDFFKYLWAMARFRFAKMNQDVESKAP